MSTFRFIHAADLHLDSPFRGMANVPEDVLGRLRESTFAALRNLVALAIRENVDFVVLSGDIYDAADRSLKAQLRLQRGLAELAEHGIAVYIIHGNHDPENGLKASLQWPDNVFVFGSAEAECRIARRRSDGEQVAAICGVSYPQQAVRDNMALRYRRLAGSDLYHIALLHANVDGNRNHDNYAPCGMRDLLASGFDYWALGHIHIRQVLHREPYIVYPGNTQGRSVKETGAKGCYIVTVNERKETSLDFHPLDDVRWFAQDVSIAGAGTEQALLERLEAAAETVREQADGRLAVVRLTVGGRDALHARIEGSALLEEMLQHLRDNESMRPESGGAVWFDSIRVQSGLPLDEEALLTQDSFLGEYFRLAGRTASDPELCEDVLREALAPLLAQPKLGPMASRAAEAERDDWLRRARELAAVLLAEPDESGGNAR
ncbi:DNA repair exonuclease [Paenibacillus sp. MSJ-34]|uniref:metallophosphoesterase family protein n=1 Tax=Paenibacillus sp. MSJ-34 TaxID=2841529 RepID=UPI001C11A024|nr:DNA repair exonuclease [Paenibacillus sp. MSJ-34]MBU5442118.1 DNA repair exonuclease [Paenibacillus sp. MSJ-34]